VALEMSRRRTRISAIRSVAGAALALAAGFIPAHGLASSSLRSPLPIAFSADSSKVLVANPNGGVAIFDAVRGGLLGEVEGITDVIVGMMPCSNGGRFIVLTETSALLLGSEHGSAPRHLLSLSEDQRAAVSPDCGRLAVYVPNERLITIAVLGTSARRVVKTSTAIADTCFVPNSKGSELAILFASGAVRVNGIRGSRDIPTSSLDKLIGIVCLQDGELLVNTSLGSSVTRRGRFDDMQPGFHCDFADGTCAQARGGRMLVSIRSASGTIAPELRIYVRDPAKRRERSHPLPATPVSVSSNRDGTLVAVAFKGSAPLVFVLKGEEVAAQYPLEAKQSSSAIQNRAGH
jgi:hypothetical protein